jgi:hypothetical protein
MSDITSVITIALGVVTVAGLIGMAFNSVRVLHALRKGVLEKGWRFISIAAFLLIFGIIALDLSVSGLQLSSLLLGFLGYSGASLEALGALSFAYGLKSQYDAWNPKEMRKEKIARAVSSSPSNSQ